MKLRAPENHGQAVSFDGQEYPIIGGFVDVPEEATELFFHGYSLANTKPQDGPQKGQEGPLKGQETPFPHAPLPPVRRRGGRRRVETQDPAPQE